MQQNTKIILAHASAKSVTSFAIAYWFDEQNNLKFASKNSIFDELNSLQLASILPKEKTSTFLMQHNGRNLFFFYLNNKKCSQSIGIAAKSIPQHIKEINLLLDSIDEQTAQNFQNIANAILGARTTLWNAKKEQKQTSHCTFNIVIPQTISIDIANKSLDSASALNMAQTYVKNLVNMPPNIITPEGFCQHVEGAIATEQLANKISVKILNKTDLQALKMGSLLGVAQGSANEPKLLVLEYKGAPEQSSAPVIFVGKGVTFDSGGINLKPSASLETMKCDMAGAATAVGSILFAAKNNLPLNIISIAACVENMPSGNALKPGDVIYASDGTSIEVIDTDAEGRLVLADALLYAQRYNPQITIDMATLTGAAIVALGHTHSAIFCKDANLTSALLEAATQSTDLAWQLPLDDEHESMLESSCADIANLCTGKGAGAQNGAVFLQRFAPKNTPWAHIDIAGTSFQKSSGGATGRPLPLISTFLINLANKNALKQ